MERHTVGEDAAFELLRAHARSSNRQLIDVATAVVDGPRYCRASALGLARLAPQAAPLTVVLTLCESGASNWRHLHDHRGAALDAPTDVPQLLGAALVLARHFGPHRAGSPEHDLEVALGPFKPRFPCGELLLSRL